VLNFIAVDLQLYKILEITRVSFFGAHCVCLYIYIYIYIYIFIYLFIIYLFICEFDLTVMISRKFEYLTVMRLKCFLHILSFESSFYL